MKKAIQKAVSAMMSLVTLLPMASSFSGALPVHAESSAVLAFPGATGAGRYATGGRGGEVYHVTNLNDSGAGSFRDAVSKSNRIVVFDVSGTIELKSNILCQSNVTVAGQTAPGGSGITLKNYKMGMSGDNIICRYISSRPGPYTATSSGNDAWGGAAGSNSIIDHCSMGWTTDEQWGLYSNNVNYTVQYSVIGPADSWGGHKKGLHGFGLMMGKGDLTFDHNLIIHNVSRNFRGKVQGTYTADFTNNVIYDWGYQTAYGTIGHLNYVNNTLKAGNSTTGGYHWMNVDSGTSPENFKVYCDGNRLINRDGSFHAITNDNWSGISVKKGIGITKDDLYSAEPFQTMQNGVDVSSVPGVESAEDAYEHVVDFAGNGISSEKRTAVDRQCAEETRTGTGSCSGTSAYDASQTNLDKYHIQCGVTYVYPDAVLTKEITDSDNDGMPDEWELARGLNPKDASDAKGDYCGQGYTNIEYYINDLTVDSFPAGTVTLSPETTVVEPRSAFETIEAENYDDQSGIKTEDCSEGGENVGYIENGDYLLFRNIDFADGANSFTARVSGGQEGCAIELYLDTLESTPVGKCRVGSTGGWQNWTDASCNIAAISGKHDLYLKFTGGDGYLFNLNHFVFGREALPLQGTYVKDLHINDTENIGDWSIASAVGVGDFVYGDRDAVTYTAIPEELTHAEYLRTACDSKVYAEDLAAFTAAQDITVYVALDSRVAPAPEWLSTWEKTDMTLQSSNDVTFQVYRKNAAAEETVVLGANGQSKSCAGYTVFVGAQTKAPVKGDVNADGALTISDLVMLQKWLLGGEEMTDPNAGDLNQDLVLNGMDLCAMRQQLMEN